MSVLVTIWETLSRAGSTDRSDDGLFSSGLDLRTDVARSRSSAERPVLFDELSGDYDKAQGARNFPEIAEEAHDMAKSDERGKPKEPEGEKQAFDTEAPDPPPELETSGLDREGSSGFGELSLDIFATDEMDDDNDVDMPDDLAEVDIETLLMECRSVGEQLLGSGRSESDK